MAQSIEPPRIKKKFIAARDYRRPWTGALPHPRPGFPGRDAEYAGQLARNGHE